MICEWCAVQADYAFPGSTHMQTGEVAEEMEYTCKGGTHCDCQHKDPGTAINKVPALSDLAKRINEGLPIA
jgi:hypothetical protein